jgi:Mn-dependent DtxR family transcriptional regulator
VTDLCADVLRVIRVFGPMSNADVARRLKVPLHQTYRAMARLCDDGMVNHLKLQEWDISERGRSWFQGQPNKPLQLFSEEA